ncbi:MAG: hypothetical protein BJ554DRAFT_6115 [Olpidium bornovanus]|uniref:Uncharacterized protein n=1 Tax=Olpidium bornovanus TaxID=278681 RepID=A0A8H7ZY97_9FUNG|nr:MAG: hypothetical protein BJ554DRAFT_6115 [Olpidium bornovanus]
MRRRMILVLALIVGTVAGPRYLPLVSASQADLTANLGNSQTFQTQFPSVVLQQPYDLDDSPPFFLDCPNTVIPQPAPKSEHTKHTNLVEDSSRPLTPLTITVHVYAMYASEAEKSLRVQAAFANTTFTFKLSSVSHFVEPTYWDLLVESNSTSADMVGSTFGPAETSMMQKYHTGGRMDLNIFITDMRSRKAGSVLLGHAYFPWMCGVDCDEKPDRLKLDGILLRSNWFYLGRSPVVQSQSEFRRPILPHRDWRCAGS